MERLRRNFIIMKARFLISMKMYFRYPINIIMTLIEPLIWLTPFYFMAKTFEVDGKVQGFEQYVGNSNVMGFAVLGFMISGYVSVVFWAMGFSLREEMEQGVLESNWSSPANRIVLMVSKSFFQFCATTFEIVLTGIVCHFAFGFTMNSEILRAMLYLIPGLIGMLGLGMAVGALVLMAKNAQPIIDITNSLVMGFSGSFFPIKVMPKGFMFISLVLPITYVYDSTRSILLGQTPLFPLMSEFKIIIISMFVLCILGNWIFMKVEKRCRMIGDLGTH